jgi:hypothetical protein
MKKPPASPLVHKLKMRRKRRLQEQRGARRGALWTAVTSDARFEPALDSSQAFARFARRFLKGRLAVVPKTGWRAKARAEAAKAKEAA